MSFSAWILVFIVGSQPVVIPHPYSTKEACEAAMSEVSEGNAPRGSYACVPVEAGGEE